jgi:hypothetical protein
MTILSTIYKLALYWIVILCGYGIASAAYYETSKEALNAATQYHQEEKEHTQQLEVVRNQLEILLVQRQKQWQLIPDQIESLEVQIEEVENDYFDKKPIEQEIENENQRWWRQSQSMRNKQQELDATPPFDSSITSELFGLDRQQTELVYLKQLGLQELRDGMYCSECGRPASQIKKETGEEFQQHLRNVRGHPKPASQSQIDKKAAEFDRKIQSIIDKINGLNEKKEQQIQRHADEHDKLTRLTNEAEFNHYERVGQLEEKMAYAISIYKNSNQQKLDRLKQKREGLLNQVDSEKEKFEQQRKELERRIDVLTSKRQQANIDVFEATLIADSLKEQELFEQEQLQMQKDEALREQQRQSEKKKRESEKKLAKLRKNQQRALEKMQEKQREKERRAKKRNVRAEQEDRQQSLQDQEERERKLQALKEQEQQVIREQQLQVIKEQERLIEQEKQRKLEQEQILAELEARKKREQEERVAEKERQRIAKIRQEELERELEPFAKALLQKSPTTPYDDQSLFDLVQQKDDAASLPPVPDEIDVLWESAEALDDPYQKSSKNLLQRTKSMVSDFTKSITRHVNNSTDGELGIDDFEIPEGSAQSTLMGRLKGWGGRIADKMGFSGDNDIEQEASQWRDARHTVSRGEIYDSNGDEEFSDEFYETEDRPYIVNRYRELKDRIAKAIRFNETDSPDREALSEFEHDTEELFRHARISPFNIYLLDDFERTSSHWSDFGLNEQGYLD